VPTGRNDFEGFSTQRIYAFFAKTRVFDEQAIDPLLLGVLDRVLGPNAVLSAPVGINIGPGETAQNLHTDDGIYPVKRPHAQFVLNTMWALDDFTEENGATQVVPGSHAWTEKAADAESRIVRAVMPAGSVMFFLGSVWHGGGANNTDRHRLGVILHYCAGWLRPQENHVIGVPREIVRELPPRLQELLGYGVHPPFVGNVDGRHPRKYLESEPAVENGVLKLD
jgi:ectoine hydroxylase-related dioxygenase (phytanoyl-CoA dioxygenase family)